MLWAQATIERDTGLCLVARHLHDKRFTTLSHFAVVGQITGMYSRPEWGESYCLFGFGLRPGAPEFGTIAEATGLAPKQIVAWILPYNLLHLAVTTALFWALSCWADRSRPADQTDQTEPPPDFHVHWHKALVPLVPFAVLFIVGPPLEILKLPTEWLADPKVPPRQSPFNSRLVGAAMLVGVAALVLLTGMASLLKSARPRLGWTPRRRRSELTRPAPGLQ